MTFVLPTSWTDRYNSERPTYRQLDYLRPRVFIGHTTVPTPEAYREWVNRASTPAERLARASRAQNDWYAKGQVGCQFARVASLTSNDHHWLRLVATVDDTRAVPDAAVVIGSAVSDPDTEVVSLLFPFALSRGEFVDLIEGISTYPPFYMDARPKLNGYRHLQLRVNVAAGPDNIASWVMAFGPDPDLPPTRRAPYFELAVRVKPKPDHQFHRLNRSPEEAHLADLPMSMSPTHWEHRWQATIEKTRTVLGSAPDERSAAKSTYSFPEDDA